MERRKKIVVGSALLIFSIPLMAIDLGSYWFSCHLTSQRWVGPANLQVAEGCVRFGRCVPTSRVTTVPIPSSTTAISNGWQLKNPDATYAVASDLTTNPSRQFSFGHVLLYFTMLDPDPSLRPHLGTWRSASFVYDHPEIAYFAYGGGRYIISTRMEFPLWPAVVLISVIWFWFLRTPARRSARPGCHRCGYDLRASPRQCPECGAISSPESSA